MIPQHLPVVAHSAVEVALGQGALHCRTCGSPAERTAPMAKLCRQPSPNRRLRPAAALQHLRRNPTTTQRVRGSSPYTPTDPPPPPPVPCCTGGPPSAGGWRPGWLRPRPAPRRPAPPTPGPRPAPAYTGSDAAAPGGGDTVQHRVGLSVLVKQTQLHVRGQLLRRATQRRLSGGERQQQLR